MDVLSDAVFDLATNPSLASLNLAVTEFADVVDPFVVDAVIDMMWHNDIESFRAVDVRHQAY